MSCRALAVAVLDQLRAPVENGGLAQTAETCGLAPLMGQPPAMAWEYYLGVWSGARQSTGRALAGLDDMYTIIVTLTVRANGQTPHDRFGPSLWGVKTGSFTDTGIDDKVDQIIECIGADVYDQRIIRRAAVILGDDLGFSQALQFTGSNDPQPVGPRWFNARGNDRQYGMKVDIRFGNARRSMKYIGDPVEI